MEDHKALIQCLFSMPTSAERMDYVQNKMLTPVHFISKSWGDVHKNYSLLASSNYDEQQSWWFDKKNEISDIASVLLCFYSDNQPDVIAGLLKSSVTTSRNHITSSEAWLNNDGNLIKMVMTFGNSEHSSKDLPRVRTVNYIVEADRKKTNTTPIELFQVFQTHLQNINKKPNSKQALVVVSPLPTDDSATPECPTHSSSCSININRHSARPKNPPTFLRDVAVKSKATKQLSLSKQATTTKASKVNVAKIKSASSNISINQKKKLKCKKKELIDDDETYYDVEHYQEMDGGNSSSSGGLLVNSDSGPPLLQNDQRPQLRQRSKTNQVDYTMQNQIVDSSNNALSLMKILISNAEEVNKKATEAVTKAAEAEIRIRNAEAVKTESLLVAAAEASKKQMQEALEHSKAENILLQKKLDEAVTAKALEDATSTWKSKVLVLESQLQSIKDGKRELETTAEATKTTVIEIFKNGLTHTENQSKRQDQLVKSILDQSQSSSSSVIQQQLLHNKEMMSSSDLKQLLLANVEQQHAKYSGNSKRKREKDKESKKKKKKKRLKIEKQEKEASILETKLQLAKEEANIRKQKLQQQLQQLDILEKLTDDAKRVAAANKTIEDSSSSSSSSSDEE